MPKLALICLDMLEKSVDTEFFFSSCLQVAIPENIAWNHISYILYTNNPEVCNTSKMQTGSLAPDYQFM